MNGTVPDGLRFAGNDLRLSRTTAGTFTFTVRVSDSSGQSATQQFTVRVLP